MKRLAIKPSAASDSPATMKSTVASRKRSAMMSQTISGTPMQACDGNKVR